PLQLVFAGQQLFTTGTGAVDVDGREYTLLGNLAIQVDLHVAGALEFLVDHFVHLRAGIHQRGSDDGQAAAFLDVPRGAEEPLGLLQSVGVDTTGQYLAGARNDGVVGASQTGDGVEQNDHVFLVLNQALGLLDDHFSDLNVTARRLVEGRCDHFAAHGALHFGHFFRTLVDQQNDQVALGVVACNVRGDVLQHQGFTGLRRCHQQTALTFADRGAQINDPRHQVFGGAIAGFHLQTIIREQGGEVFEQDLV